jgi:hypothetical protein
MHRVRAADDFDAIRLRLEELCRERDQSYAGGPARRSRSPEREGIAQPPEAGDTRTPLVLRRQIRARFSNAR